MRRLYKHTRREALMKGAAIANNSLIKGVYQFIYSPMKGAATAHNSLMKGVLTIE